MKFHHSSKQYSLSIMALYTLFQLHGQALAQAGNSSQQGCSLLNSHSTAEAERHTENNQPPATLENLTALAQQAQKNGITANACKLWFDVAKLEADAKQFDAAINHAKLAIELDQVRIKQYEYPQAILPWSTGVIHELTQNGRPLDAETLLLQAVSHTQKIYGAQSQEFDSQLAQLVCFYMTNKNSKKALGTLDKLLTLDPRKLEINQYKGPTGRSSIQELALTLARNREEEQTQLSLKILEKLLSSQKQFYSSDNYHIAELLSALAEIECLSQDKQLSAQGEKHFQEAEAIERLYGGNLPSSNSISGSYIIKRHAQILKQMGKTSEAETLLKQEATTRKCRAQRPIPPNTASPASLTTYYNWASRSFPYSPQATICLNSLLEAYSQRGKEKWPKLAELAPKALTIQEHSSPFVSTGCILQESPSTTRERYFLLAIQAFMNLHDEERVNFYLEKALENQSYSPSVEELVFFARLENLAGNKSKALKFGEMAKAKLAPLSPNYTQETFRYYQLAAIFKEAGDSSQEQELYEAVNVLRIKERQAEEIAKTMPESSGRQTQADTLHKQMGDNQTLPIQDSHRSISNSQSPTELLPVAKTQNKTSPQINTVENTYCMQYAALAINSLILEEGAQLKECDERLLYKNSNCTFAGSYNLLKAAQTIHHADNFSFLYSGQTDALTTLEVYKKSLGIGQYCSGGIAIPPGILFGPPTAPTLPFKECQVAPAKAIALGEAKGELILKPGDYTASKIHTNQLIISPAGRVRIFLTDHLPNQEPVFLTSDHSFINSTTPIPGFRPNLLEIWYSGKNTIKLADKASFCGIIYAPNAKVELGPGSVKFSGAIVAKDIHAHGNVEISYMTMLRSWQP